ncbi:MAG: rRNA methyltransferase [Xanthomonadales bacterium]|nr:rRNA methyltransferase [Xanthomonadales bacterium]
MSVDRPGRRGIRPSGAGPDGRSAKRPQGASGQGPAARVGTNWHDGAPAEGRIVKPDQRQRELRVFGLNACLAVFNRRPAAIRKVWLVEARLPALREVLRDCAARRVGYRVVAPDDLERLTGSQHHEGVCFEVLRAEPPALADLLAGLPAGPAQLVMLDGVGNPHNLGATLRSAAHFGVAAVLAEGLRPPLLSGAACRVAEGGAEHVPLLRVDTAGSAQLRDAGFLAVATVVRGGQSLHRAALPQRILWLLGAEGPGLSPARQAGAAMTVHIPGSGAVDSLNVAAAAAVLFGEHLRQHPAPGIA